MSPPVDISGQRFGHLLALALSGSSREKRFWTCRCDCGRTKKVRTSHLRSGQTTSCGCRQRTHRLPPGEAGFRQLLLAYRTRAKRNKREFLLSEESFRLLTKSKCHYCGTAPAHMKGSDKWHSSATNENSKYVYNGLDRQDSALGYVEGNVVTCCGICNSAKLDRSVDDFLAWVSRVYRNTVG